MYYKTKKRYINTMLIICCLLVTIIFNNSNSYAKEILLDASTNEHSIDGDFVSIAVMKDGTVWTWGSNIKGQLGDGTTVSNSSKPVKVKNLTDIKSVSCNAYHVMALKKDGTVWTWGLNDNGECGDGTKNDRNIPGKVQGLNDIQEIVTGVETSLALKKDGTVWGWGFNSAFILEEEKKASDHLRPVKIQDLVDIKAIDMNNYSIIALKRDGTVWTCGNNNHFGLGDGTTKNSRIPVKVKCLTNVKAVAAGDDFFLALKEDGTVWAWGSNNGKLGDGTTDDRKTIVQVQGLTEIKNIVASSNHSIALKEDGTVWSWGFNNFGQLGDGTENNSNIPIKVQELENIKTIGAGDHYSLAVKDDGSIWTWGCNYDGKLGIGSVGGNVLSPVKVINTGLIKQPRNLNAINENGHISLTWDAVEDVDGYNIKKSTNLNSIETIVGTNITDTTYIDNDVEPGVTYYYVVQSVKDGVESEYSNVAFATIKASDKIIKLVLEVKEQKQLSITDDLTDNIKMTWTSSDANIATVDANGKVKALEPGNTVITCENEDGSYTEIINVLVVDLDLQLAVDLNIGEKCRLTVGNLMNTVKVTWKADDSTIATVSTKGKVTAISEGLTYITAFDETGKELGRIYVRIR